MRRTTVSRYAVAAMAVGVVVIIKAPVEFLAGSGPPLILFVPAVTISAWFGGFGPGITATALSVLICDILFFMPVGTLWVQSRNELVQLGVFILEGTLTSLLMQQLIEARRQSEASATEAKSYRETLEVSEQAIRRERDFAQSLIATAQAIVLVLDRSGRVLRFNPFVLQVTGRLPGEVQSADWFAEFLPLADQARARAAFQRALVEPEGSQIIHSILVGGGRLREFEWAHALLPRDTGGILTIGHDITDLRDAQQRALQAERLAAIGQMVTGLAHESRNALQRSQACLEMLRHRVNSRPEMLDLVVGVQEAQDDLHRLYEEVRNYAAPIRLERAPCPLRDVLHEAWTHLEPQWKHRAVQICEHGLEAPVCAVDRFRLGQVFRNILDNALAASHDPVQIDVEWTEAEADGAPAVRVVLTDSGPGLTPEQRRNLFEPFFTTKTQGTGLGMAIAKRIVEAHGGAIGADGRHGPGGAIVITLPRGSP